MPRNTPSQSSVWHNRNFVRYLFARMLATVAIQMQSVAVGWQVYELTESLFDLGLVGLFQFLPFVVLVLFAGQLADRYDRRTIIVWCLGLQLLCSLLFLAVSGSGLTAPWPMFAILVLFGGARAFIMPATQAVLTSLVRADNINQAVALGSTSFQVAMIVGPALGGLICLSGPATVYLTVVALFALSLGLTLYTRIGLRTIDAPPPRWRAVLDGLKFVCSRPLIVATLSLDLFAVLFGGATALLPAYAHDVLQAGPTTSGLLRAAPAIGAICIAAVLTFRPLTRRVGYALLASVALFGSGSLMLGWSSSLPFAMAALTLMGCADMVSVYIRQTLVQRETPDPIRGRVSAVNSVFIGASNELGEFESGLVAEWWGLRHALIVGGFATIAFAFFWAWRFPTLRQLDRFPQ